MNAKDIGQVVMMNAYLDNRHCCAHVLPFKNQRGRCCSLFQRRTQVSKARRMPRGDGRFEIRRYDRPGENGRGCPGNVAEATNTRAQRDLELG